MVDRGGLENRCAERYRGFESLLLRSIKGIGLNIRCLFCLYTESLWMWRQNGVKDLSKNIDRVSSRTTTSFKKVSA